MAPSVVPSGSRRRAHAVARSSSAEAPLASHSRALSAVTSSARRPLAAGFAHDRQPRPPVGSVDEQWRGVRDALQLKPVGAVESSRTAHSWRLGTRELRPQVIS